MFAKPLFFQQAIMSVPTIWRLLISKGGLKMVVDRNLQDSEDW